MADRITFLGHATVLLELGGTRLLTDPVLRERFLLVRRHVPLPDPRHLEDIDAVLISHLHHDHLDFRSLRALAGKPPLIVGAGGGRTLRRRLFRRVTELSPGDEHEVGGVMVEATRAVHDARRFKLGPRVEALGYLIRTGARGV